MWYVYCSMILFLHFFYNLITICNILVDKANEWKTKAGSKLKVQEILDEAEKGYSYLGNDYSELSYKNKSIKKIYASQFMSYLGITGIYFPFTGEANINIDVPIHETPFTTCHEMAHQIGFAKEEEANFIAYLACINNPNPNFKYAGYLAASRYCMLEMRYLDKNSYETIKDRYSSRVLQDLVSNYEYWNQFETPLNSLSSFINDLFLKANNQKEGVESYNLMVELLLGEFNL